MSLPDQGKRIELLMAAGISLEAAEAVDKIVLGCANVWLPARSGRRERTKYSDRVKRLLHSLDELSSEQYRWEWIMAGFGGNGERLAFREIVQRLANAREVDVPQTALNQHFVAMLIAETLCAHGIRVKKPLPDGPESIYSAVVTVVFRDLLQQQRTPSAATALRDGTDPLHSVKLHGYRAWRKAHQCD